MKIADKMLFLRYAMPCVSTFVTRGKVSQEEADHMIEQVSHGKVPETAMNLFKVAHAMCEVTAGEMNKKVIDAEVTRQYFHVKHNDVVNSDYALMHDFNPDCCKIHIGKVMAVDAGRATVETKIETELGQETMVKPYRTDFCKVKVGDEVVVHYDFIVERASEEMLKRIIRA